MKRFLAFALLAMAAFGSCKKDTAITTDPTNPTDPVVATLSVSRPILAVSTFSGYSDTFTVQSNIDWSITLSAGLSSWLTLDSMKGGAGQTVIKLSISNNATASQTGTITVSPVNNTTVSPQVITVKQQVYSLLWQKVYNTTGTSGISAVIQDTDGGLVFSGTTNTGWLFKTDANGNKLWSTSTSASGYLSSVAKTPDGGYVATGWKNPTTPVNTGQDLAVVKFNASGAIVWEKYFGGGDNENGFKVITTSDGGYLISALTYSADGDVSVNRGNGDMWLLKVDANGNKVWEKTFGGSGYDYEAYITATTDGGYLLAGGTSSNDGDISGFHGGSDLVIFKLDASGNKIWNKIYGGSKSDRPFSFITTKDGGSIVVGRTSSTDGDVSGLHGSDYDMWVVKLDNKGQKTWQATLGSTNWEEGVSIAEMPDGSYMALGFTYGNDGDVNGNHGDKDFWVVNLSNTGKKLWQRPFGSPGTDGPDAVTATADGGFVIAGLAQADGGDVTGIGGVFKGWVVKCK
jgi:hypothetical protein